MKNQQNKIKEYHKKIYIENGFKMETINGN